MPQPPTPHPTKPQPDASPVAGAKAGVSLDGTVMPTVGGFVPSESVLAAGRQLHSLPPDAPLELAQSAGYRLLEKLGQGGMGAVFKGEQVCMNRLVAIKVLTPELVGDPEAVRRFKEEATAAAQLKHPNIVTVHLIDQEGGVHFLVMEFLEGTTLSRLVAKKGPLPICHACNLIRQAALGLQHASDAGMVHRDIKPQNLMVTRDGLVKILDFGLARLPREKRGDAASTVANTWMGTPEYMAPEQARDAHSADIRADIYSLGCTLFFLLSGRPPFRRDNLVDLMLAHAQHQPPSLLDLRPDASPELAAVVARMLAKRREDRYQTPGDLARELQPWAAGAPNALPDCASLPTHVADAPTGATVPPGIARGDTAPAVAALDSTPTGQPRGGRAGWRGPIVVGLLAVTAAVVGLLATRPPPDGTLVLEVNEPDAEVFLNGERAVVRWTEQGRWAEMTLKPNIYQVEVRKVGFKAAGETVSIPAGRSTVLKANLAKLPDKADPGRKPDKPQPPVKPAKGSPGFRLLGGMIGKWERHGVDLVDVTRKAGWGPARILFGDPEWSDYDFNVDAFRPAGAAFALLFRCQGEPGGHYGFQVGSRLKPDKVFVYAAGSGASVPVKERLFKQWPEFKKGPIANRTYAVRVVIRGSIASCFLDNRKAFDAVIGKSGKGSVGFATWGEGCRFRNIRVSGPAGKTFLDGLPDLSDKRGP